MQIQSVEELVGITKKNIRFYEKEGLLSPTRKADNGYRDYNLEDIACLERIKLLRKLNVSIDEIREIFSGKKTLDACLYSHMQNLEKQKQSIEVAIELSKQLTEQSDPLAESSVKNYLDMIENMEKKGVKFMDIHKKDKEKKYKGALIAAIIVTIGVALWTGVILFTVLQSADMLTFSDIAIVILVLLVPAVVLISVWVALSQRFKQIKSGEEDIASKY